MRRTAECIDVKKGLRIVQTFFSIGNFVLPEELQSESKEFPKETLKDRSAVFFIWTGGKLRLRDSRLLISACSAERHPWNSSSRHPYADNRIFRSAS